MSLKVLIQYQSFGKKKFIYQNATSFFNKIACEIFVYNMTAILSWHIFRSAEISIVCLDSG